MSALELVRSALNTGGEHLGDMVWWQLADARIRAADLEAAWVGAGLPVELLPEAPSTERAFKHAVREAQVGQPTRLLRLAKEDAVELVYAVVHEQRLGDGSLTYDIEARVSLVRAQDGLATDQVGHDLVVDVQRRFRELRTTHVADDVRRSIVRALDSFAAIAVRPSGGVYWAPARYAHDLLRLQRAISAIGHSQLYLLPVHRTGEAVATLGAVAQASLEAELAGLHDEIDAFTQMPPGRPSTLLRRFGAFEELRGRAELYRQVLAVQVTGLDQQLDQLAATVEQLLAAKNQAA
jgi:hypothetical protein